MGTIIDIDAFFLEYAHGSDKLLFISSTYGQAVFIEFKLIRPMLVINRKQLANRKSNKLSCLGSKTTRICIYICVVYITLTMPSITSQLLFHTIPTLSKSQTMSDIFIMTYMLSLFNTVSNPLVYAIFQKKFFSELKQIWTTLKRLFCCQRGVNHLGNTLTTSNVKV